MRIIEVRLKQSFKILDHDDHAGNIQNRSALLDICDCFILQAVHKSVSLVASKYAH